VTRCSLSGIGRYALPIEMLQEAVQHQRDRQQKHQGFDSFRRVQIQGVNGQRAFELAVDVLRVDLLFVLPEQLVAAGLVKRYRGDQRRVAVILLIRLDGLGVEREHESMGGPFFAAGRCRQGRTLLLRQRHHLPIEILTDLWR